MKRAAGISAILVLLCVCSDAALCSAGQPARGDREEFFEREIRPLLVERCQKCHGTKKSEGSLRLISREAILRGGDTGPAAVAGKPQDSLLIKAVSYVDEPKMPPDGKLSERQIAALTRWVTLGLPWPDAADAPAPKAPATKVSQAAGAGGARWTSQQRNWWAFQPVRPIAPPPVRESAAIRNPIDRFVQARLESAGISPFPPADRRVLIRRATYDLTGLPPTPAEVDAFVSDSRPDAFALLVDRLLATPEYGERWGRQWLDIVRYADYYEDKPGSHGSAAKFELFQAYRYRDWVVRSLNRDMPYDQFLIHQIAGDKLLGPHGESPYDDGQIATTVLAIGSWDNGDADKDKVVSDIVDDQINVIGQSFLGLTLACARCHDHKFDPVSNKDYYALAGIFYSSHVLATVGTKGDHTVLLRTPIGPRDAVARRQKQLDELARIKDELDRQKRVATAAKTRRSAPAGDKRRMAVAESSDALVRLTAKQAKLRRQLLPPPPVAMGIQDGGTTGGIFPGIQDVPIHVRGSYSRLGEIVPRRLPEFFAGKNQSPIRSGSGRLELARWVADATNPLTPRVLVNRVWQGHFGEGLVGTPNNFGRLGEPPTHPELLDWLAGEFIRSGWSIKSLHRLIMNSAAYQRAASMPKGSEIAAAALNRDPENRLLSRYVPRRLESECIRDGMLAASGRLDRRAGGPATASMNSSRRSLYVQTTRWTRAYFSTLFDAADPDQPIGKRNVTAVAPQALFFLNHPFVRSQAAAIAARLAKQSSDDSVRLASAYRLLFSRTPNHEEATIAGQFLREDRSAGTADSWTDLIQVLFASNEFCYVD